MLGFLSHVMNSSSRWGMDPPPGELDFGEDFLSALPPLEWKNLKSSLAATKSHPLTRFDENFWNRSAVGAGPRIVVFMIFVGLLVPGISSFALDGKYLWTWKHFILYSDNFVLITNLSVSAAEMHQQLGFRVKCWLALRTSLLAEAGTELTEQQGRCQTDR